VKTKIINLSVPVRTAVDNTDTSKAMNFMLEGSVPVNNFLCCRFRCVCN